MKKLKKKKRKGFTLVELIAVIAILGVILTIAGISIVSIRKNVNEKQRLNLQSTLKSAAQGYHDDTGVNIVPVGVLLQIGAVQADTTNYEGDGYEKGDPVILDPVDGQPINCDAIVYNEEGEAEYVPDKGCSTEAIEENSLQLQVQIGTASPVVYNPNNWIKLNSTTETVKFIPILSTSDELEYTWTNIYAPDTSETGKTYTLPIPDSGYVETELRLETTYNGVLLYQDFEVKVDAKDPVITNDGIVDSDEWRKSKTIIATFADAESGLSGYKLLKESGNCATDGTWKDISGKLQDVSEAVTENGNYKFCVKDIVGHIAETKNESLKVIKIDNTPPKISVSVENGEAYAKAKTGTITFTEVGDDEQNTVGFGGDQLTFKYGWSLNANAACSTLDHTGTFSPAAGSKTSSTTVTINGETGAGYLIVCAVDIHDALGNAMNTTSSVKAKMYLDNQAPTITGVTVKTQGSGYNSGTVNVTVSGVSDGHSGVKQICLLQTDNVSNCEGNWITTSESSYTFNNQVVSGEGSGISTTFYAFAQDNVENKMTSGKASSKYTVYKYCTNEYAAVDPDFGECTKKCGTGTHSKTQTMNDYYFKDHYCRKNNVTENCNTQDCCSQVTYTDTKTCNASCDTGGTGKYKREAYSKYDGQRCSSKDDSKGDNCSIECCSTGYDDSINKYAYYNCNSVYISSCQPECNGSSRYCKNTSGTKYKYSDLYWKKPNSCRTCSASDYSICDTAHTWKTGNTFIYTTHYDTGGYGGTVKNTETLYILEVSDYYSDVYVRTTNNYHSTNKYTSDPIYLGYIYKGCIDIYKGTCVG